MQQRGLKSLTDTQERGAARLEHGLFKHNASGKRRVASVLGPPHGPAVSPWIYLAVAVAVAVTVTVVVACGRANIGRQLSPLCGALLFLNVSCGGGD